MGPVGSNGAKSRVFSRFGWKLVWGNVLAHHEDWEAKNPDFPIFWAHFDPGWGQWGLMGQIPQLCADLAQTWRGAMFLPTMKIGSLKIKISPFFDPILTLNRANGVKMGQIPYFSQFGWKLVLVEPILIWTVSQKYGFYTKTVIWLNIHYFISEKSFQSQFWKKTYSMHIMVNNECCTKIYGMYSALGFGY